MSFGATCKRLEDYFAVFILEFEKLLRQLDFDTAKIQLETELLGNFNFFWKSKKSYNSSFYKNDKMIETEEWFFGFGNRNRWGILIYDLLNEEILISIILAIQSQYKIILYKYFIPSKKIV